jgi:hypothetical protein
MEELARSIKTFLNENKMPCFISTSVREEIQRIIDRIHIWMQRDIKEHFQTFLDKKGLQEFTRNDSLIFEPYFEERRNQLRADGSPAYFFKILRMIERWVISYVKNIPFGKKIPLDLFLAYLSAELTREYERILARVEVIPVQNITPAPELRTFLLMHGIRQIDDQDHLASAIQYQYKNDLWSVFVTNDERTILTYRNMLERCCSLFCTKPEYAIDRSNSLNERGILPMTHFREIKEHSDEQIAFARSVFSAISVKLVDSLVKAS